MMPPHATFIETHLGGGAIMKRKAPCLRSIGIDLDPQAVDNFECPYPVELIQGCAHNFLKKFPFTGTEELVYCDPPCLLRTKTQDKRYRYRFDYKELPPIPERQKGKRGKVAKSDAHNLLERLQLHEKAVLLFARESHVPFTNNRAERDLRMGKVKQKVSGCFRVEKYAIAYCRISSYLQTMSAKGYNPLVAIQIALAGKAG
jgi:transposase